MSSGYTSCIKDGASFEKFVLTCARAFGALVTRRDEPIDAPIVPFVPPDYHKKEARRLKSQLARYKSMSSVGISKLAMAEWKQLWKSYNAVDVGKADLLKKYQEMLDKVQKWIPPSPDHKNLKEFMIVQIRQSIEFDCSPSHRTEPPSKPKSPREWLNSKVLDINRLLDYHRTKYAEEVDNCKGRNRWISELKASLATKK